MLELARCFELWQPRPKRLVMHRYKSLREMKQVNYRITELNGWVIVTPTGKAQNNEPLRVKYLFRRWLSREGARVIVNLKGLAQLGVWEVGLLTSFKREIESDFSAGSVGDYIDSLMRLRCFSLHALYPGHGKISLAPMDDSDHAIAMRKTCG